MKIILSILQKTIVNHFYKVNTGFFLFIFFVLFGLPYNVSTFHLSIIHSIIQSPIILLIVLALWLLYNFKCMDYTVKQLQEPQQNFLYCLHAISMKNLVTYFLYAQGMMYMPVLLYAIAIIIVAWNAGEFYVIANIIFFNAAILFPTAYLYALVLQRRFFAKRFVLFPGFHFRIRKHFFSVPLFFLINNRKQMLLVTKFFSLLLLLFL